MSITNQYTVFCQEDTGRGTIWIDCVTANDHEEAADLGLAKCAEEWGMPIKEVRVLGVAEGNVNILFWDDIE